MSFYAQLIANGLIISSVYASLSVSFSLTYGVLRVVNFCHGAICISGGMAFFLLTSELRTPLWIGLPAAALLTALLGVLVERVAVRPFFGRPSLHPMIATLAVAIVIENILAAGFGHAAHSTRAHLPPPVIFEVLHARVSSHNLSILALGVAMCIAVYLYVHYTPFGHKTLALADDPEVAATLGIRRNHVIAVNCAISGALAGATGVLLSLEMDIAPYIGTPLVFKAFAANLIFRPGSLMGAFAGGFVLGFLETFVGGFISSRYESAITLAIVIIVLIARPAGILGQYQRVV